MEDKTLRKIGEALDAATLHSRALDEILTTRNLGVPATLAEAQLHSNCLDANIIALDSLIRKAFPNEEDLAMDEWVTRLGVE